jgi:hypothetical protein
MPPRWRRYVVHPISGHYTSISPKHNNFAFFARALGKEVCLPEPAVLEAESHWVRELKREIHRSEGRLRALLRKVNHADAIVIPDLETCLRHYRKTLEQTTRQLKYTSVPMTNRALTDLFNQAIHCVPPFRDGDEGKGFQDSVILCSVIDHLAQPPSVAAVLVSNDGRFKEPDLTEYLTRANLRLQVFEADEILCHLRTAKFHAAAESVWKEIETVWEKENASAWTAIDGARGGLKQLIEGYLRENAPSIPCLGPAAEVISIKHVEIKRVDTPIPDLNKRDRHVAISVNVMAMLEVLVKRVYEGIEALLWTRRPPGHQNVESLLIIDAEADMVDGNCRDISFNSAKFF